VKSGVGGREVFLLLLFIFGAGRSPFFCFLLVFLCFSDLSVVWVVSVFLVFFLFFFAFFL